LKTTVALVALALLVGSAGCTAILDLDRDFQESPPPAGSDGSAPAGDATAAADSTTPGNDANGGSDTATGTDTGTGVDSGVDSGRRRDGGGGGGGFRDSAAADGADASGSD
jgi:hypothetical protein